MNYMCMSLVILSRSGLQVPDACAVAAVLQIAEIARSDVKSTRMIRIKVLQVECTGT